MEVYYDLFFPNGVFTILTLDILAFGRKTDIWRPPDKIGVKVYKCITSVDVKILDL